MADDFSYLIDRKVKSQDNPGGPSEARVIEEYMKVLGFSMVELRRYNPEGPLPENKRAVYVKP